MFLNGIGIGFSMLKKNLSEEEGNSLGLCTEEIARRSLATHDSQLEPLKLNLSQDSRLYGQG